MTLLTMHVTHDTVSCHLQKTQVILEYNNKEKYKLSEHKYANVSFCITASLWK